MGDTDRPIHADRGGPVCVNAGRVTVGQAAGLTQQLLLEVTIPTLPPSVNKVYVPVTVRQRGQKAYNSIRMGKDATDWIGQATLFLPPVRLPDNQLYRMVLEYHTDWYLKDGVTLKNKDVRNYEKLVTDTVFRRYGLSDKLVWESVVMKRQNKNKEKVVVRLFKADPVFVDESAAD